MVRGEAIASSKIYTFERWMIDYAMMHFALVSNALQ